MTKGNATTRPSTDSSANMVAPAMISAWTKSKSPAVRHKTAPMSRSGLGSALKLARSLQPALSIMSRGVSLVPHGPCARICCSVP